MGYEIAAQMEVDQVGILVEAELEAASMGEFLLTGLASLALMIIVSAIAYLAVVAVVTLGISGL